MTAFETYIQSELPRRPALVTAALASYDGDPNSSSAPNSLRLAPVGTFYLQATPDVLWRKARSSTWVPLSFLNSYETTPLYVSSSGDDDAPGTEDSPIQSLRELSLRLPIYEGAASVRIGAGTFRGVNVSGEGLDSRLVIGGSRNTVVVEGTLSEITTFTVASSSGITVTAAGSPGWEVNEHRFKFLEYFVFGSFRHLPIISNTSDTLTIVLGSTAIGGFYPLPPVSTELRIVEQVTVIAPPLTNPGSFNNRFIFQKFVEFFGIAFDGSGGGFSGPTCTDPGSNYQFSACDFRNWSGRGLEGHGTGIVFDSIFRSCGDACIESAGYVQVNDCLYASSATGIRAAFGGVVNVGAGSFFACMNITQQAWNIKTRGIVNDESVRVYYSSVRDFIYAQRSAHYQKVNAPLISINGFGALTRYLVRIEGGGNKIDLLSSSTADVTAGTAYVRFDAAARNFSKTQYQDADYNIDDILGNHVYDGGSF